MAIEYKKISSLEMVAEDANSDIPADNNYEFNSYLAYEIDVKNLITGKLADVSNEAKMWAADSCPEEFYINHGSYIQGGMKHIINELKNKPSSNRALFSLISQDHILNSGDKPIPSFMLLQTGIEDNILYCTTYFRVIEISVFLRINLEEIRQKLVEIYNSLLNFRIVRLVIFSFRAYKNNSISPLRKPKIDLLTSIRIYKLLHNNPASLGDLLREKAKGSTVIDTRSLKDLKEALLEDEKEDENKQYNIDYVKNLLDSAIEKSEKLKELRKLHSHHESVLEITNCLSTILTDIAGEFDKCH